METASFPLCSVRIVNDRPTPNGTRTRDAIEAHLTMVFTALAVSRTVQNRADLSIRRLLRLLKPLRSATIEINGVITTLPPAIHPAVEATLNALRDPGPRHQSI